MIWERWEEAARVIAKAGVGTWTGGLTQQCSEAGTVPRSRQEASGSAHQPGTASDPLFWGVPRARGVGRGNRSRAWDPEKGREHRLGGTGTERLWGFSGSLKLRV